MIQPKKVFYTNNLNLIRLFAAMQVAHFHLVSIFGIEITHFHQLIVKFLGFFPGVPVFFFISGFLISKSWEESESIRSYSIRRLARIEPALLVSVVFAIALTYFSGYFAFINYYPTASELLTLFLSKTTILQFYNQDFLRSYGDGVLNGSLWTITVEIQFYFLVPIIYWGLKLKEKSINWLIALFIVFMLINTGFDLLHNTYPEHIGTKLLSVSFLPWFFMFIAGIIFQRKFDFFISLLRGRFTIVATVYIAACLLGLHLNADFGNSLNPIMFVLLCCVIFSAAYTKPNISSNLIGNIDISYAVYLYHMPIINYCLFKKFAPDYLSGALMFFIIIAISTISWLCIERHFLVWAKNITKPKPYTQKEVHK
jgi:peptidoglycan/LPS O-acetylase OafA/YrhL